LGDLIGAGGGPEDASELPTLCQGKVQGTGSSANIKESYSQSNRTLSCCCLMRYTPLSEVVDPGKQHPRWRYRASCRMCVVISASKTGSDNKPKTSTACRQEGNTPATPKRPKLAKTGI